jgi:hypothetical protein
LRSTSTEPASRKGVEGTSWSRAVRAVRSVKLLHRIHAIERSTLSAPSTTAQRSALSVAVSSTFCSRSATDSFAPVYGDITNEAPMRFGAPRTATITTTLVQEPGGLQASTATSIRGGHLIDFNPQPPAAYKRRKRWRRRFKAVVGRTSLNSFSVCLGPGMMASYSAASIGPTHGPELAHMMVPLCIGQKRSASVAPVPSMSFPNSRSPNRSSCCH